MMRPLLFLFCVALGTAQRPLARVTFYCSEAGQLYPVAPAGERFRALAGPLGACRDKGQLLTVAREGTVPAAANKARNDASIADVDMALSTMRPEVTRDNGRLGPIQAELQRLRKAPVVVSAPQKVLEKATSGLKDIVKTQV